MRLFKLSIYVIIIIAFSLPFTVSGQLAVADVDSIALTTSQTITVYTAETMWRDVLLTARGCNVAYKPAFSIADTSQWATMQWAILVAGATIGFAKDYNSPSIPGLRAIKARAVTGTGALIMMGGRKGY